MLRGPMSRRTKTVWLGLGAALLLVLVLAGSLLAMSVLGSPTPTTARGPAHFVEEAAALAHTYDGPDEFAVGGGVAAFDCNGDGRPELYLAGGANPAALYRNDSPTGGALRFTRLPSSTTDLSAVNGAYPIDLDGDGLTDLVVLRNGENVLLRGLGDCRFERANERWGFAGGAAPTEAFSATWEADTTFPTLAFGNYVRPELNDPHHLCYDDELVRPRPAGDAYAPPIPLSPSWCTLSMLFSDWDRSGRRDLRVSNDLHYYLPDEGQEQLWRIAPGEPPRLYTDADGWATVQVQGMGIASYDLTGDGYPEYFLTSQAASRLQTLLDGPAHPTFREVGLKAGVNVSQPFTGDDTRPSTAWHSEFVDVNNDGFVDLFVAKGNIDQVPDYAQKDPSNLLLGQPDGTFKESADAAGILSFERGRGAALADLNLDGLPDLVEVNYGAPVKIWRNVGSGDAAQPAPMGHWLTLQVSQPGPNRDAIGAWLEVKVGDLTLRRELTIGGGHASGELGWVHFGLGPADQAQVRVTWPDGEVGPWQSVKADQFVLVARGSGPQSWQPPAP
jgi:enediyne biosynthesis protein E4